MDFEYDPRKSASNKVKHGIDFDEAQALWQDQNLLIVGSRSVDEPRFVAIGRIGTRCWTTVFTIREENIRIISVRRARPEEIERYERQ